MKFAEADLECICQLLSRKRLFPSAERAAVLHEFILLHLGQVGHARAVGAVVVVAIVAVGTLAHLLLFALKGLLVGLGRLLAEGVFGFGPAVEQQLRGGALVQVELEVVGSGLDLVESVVEVGVEGLVAEGGEVAGLGLLRHVLPVLAHVLEAVGPDGLLLLDPPGPEAALGHALQHLPELPNSLLAELLLGLSPGTPQQRPGTLQRQLAPPLHCPPDLPPLRVQLLHFGQPFRIEHLQQNRPMQPEVLVAQAGRLHFVLGTLSPKALLSVQVYHQL